MRFLTWFYSHSSNEVPPTSIIDDRRIWANSTANFSTNLYKFRLENNLNPPRFAVNLKKTNSDGFPINSNSSRLWTKLERKRVPEEGDQEKIVLQSEESQSMDDFPDAFQQFDHLQPENRAKRRRLRQNAGQELSLSSRGFRFGQFLSVIPSLSDRFRMSLESIKKWIKAPDNDSSVDDCLDKMTKNGDYFVRTPPPIIDLTEERDQTCISHNGKYDNCEFRSRFNFETSEPSSSGKINLPIFSPHAPSNIAEEKITSDNDVVVLDAHFRPERRWRRHEKPRITNSNRMSTLTTPVSRLNFNQNRLLDHLSTIKNGSSNDRSLLNVFNLEERDRYRELLMGLGAGTVSFNRRAKRCESTNRRQNGNLHQKQLSTSKHLLNQLVDLSKIDDSPRQSPSDDSVIMVENIDSQLSRLPKWDQKKADELSRKLVLDPAVVSREIREDFLPRSEQRQRLAKELIIEGQLRRESRRMREQAYEDEVRLRLKLEGLSIPEYESEVDEFPELSAHCQLLVDEAWCSGPPTVVLSKAFSLEICRKDLLTLRGLDWLNDEVINFYMNLIVDRARKDSRLPKVFAFTTFFYPKVLKSGHSTVKRWTRKTDIFSYDFLLVPVHLGVHWCLATINFRTKTFDYYDSMGGTNETCFKTMCQYLDEESLDKRKIPFKMDDWNSFYRKDIPHQMNGSDCGMFACKFAEFASRNANITFEQEHMPYFRRRMVAEICDQKLL